MPKIAGSPKAAARTRASRRDPLPKFVTPQLARLAETAPVGYRWVHEIKYDGYRIHARIDRREVRLLTRTGLDWTKRYLQTAEAVRKLPASQAYLDGELCAVGPHGETSFALMQSAMDQRRTDDLVFFLFDILHLDGRSLIPDPLIERKARLVALLDRRHKQLVYSEHLVGDGQTILNEACNLGAEGPDSKRVDARYVPGNRGLWLKTKCLRLAEYVAF
jgi:ATP-dependent DNA ligase